MTCVLVLGFSLLLSACGTNVVQATPTVSGVAGDPIHNTTMTIQGTDFGVKSPAAPLVWDNAEDRTVNTPTAVIDEGSWTERWPRTGIKSSWLLQYRSVPFRAVNGPHSRSAQFLVGGHWSNHNDTAKNVMVTHHNNDAPSNEWYASWYVRIDPDWPLQSAYSCYDDYGRFAWNYKEFVYQGGNTAYWMGEFNYTNIDGGHLERRLNPLGYRPQMLCGMNDAVQLKALCGYQDRYNEYENWQHREIVLKKNPGWYKNRSWDGVHDQGRNYNCECSGDLQPDWLNGIKSFTIGGFFKASDYYIEGYYQPIRDLTDTTWYTWQQRGSSDIYYVTFNGYLSDPAGDPDLVDPALVDINGSAASRGSDVASLAYNQFWFGDVDSLGYSTIYVRMPNGVAQRNPGASGRCTVILTSPTSGGGAHNGRLDPNAWRYFDDMYVDTTHARVVMANNSDYESATIVEPQIPSAWSDTEITFTVNLGMLSETGTRCLFVFDADNNRSPASCLSNDLTRPANPQNLRVN